MNKEGTDADDEHQQDPDRSNDPMRQRALGRCELHRADYDRAHRGESMKLNIGTRLK